MSTIRRFEEIVVWQKSQALAIEIYGLFRENKDYTFRDQIQRATVSISNNIAEGFERDTAKDFVRFLYMARGSSGEVRSMLYLARRLQYLNEEKLIQLKNDAEEISKMIKGFIRSVQAKNK